MSDAAAHQDLEKRSAAQAAAELVRAGDRVGLGTGTTVAHFLPALARRELPLRCVATSPATERAARDLGLAVEPFAALEVLDIAVDGADQISPEGWLVKGGGGALTREKIVAATARRFVVIVSSDKLVERIAAPIPLELMTFGLTATLARLATATIRDQPLSPDGGVIADYTGTIDDPAAIAAWLSAQPGVVEHGLFPPALTTDVLVGKGDDVQRIRR